MKATFFYTNIIRLGHVCPIIPEEIYDRKTERDIRMTERRVHGTVIKEDQAGAAFKP